jgi:hypothetical protein
MPTAAKDMDLEIPGGVKYLYGTAGFRMRYESEIYWTVERK